MLHVTPVCTPCRILLHVVGSCCAKFQTGQTLEPTTPNIYFVWWSSKRSTTMLNPFAQLFHAVSQGYKILWVVSFPRCTISPKMVGSCCIRLQVALRFLTFSGTQGQIVGARESLNGRENMAEKKSKERPEEPFFTFLRALFFRPFRLFLAPTICPWVSEDAFVIVFIGTPFRN